MRRILTAMLVCALGLLGTGTPASAAVQRPFKATFSGATSGIDWAPRFDITNPDISVTSTFGGRCPGGANWVISFEGTGHGTHLGQFTWSSSHCTRLTSLAPPNAVISDGRLDFVSANGDVLHEDYVAAGGIVLEGDQLCVDTAATFNGGTGRFEHASGSALEHGCWPASTVGPILQELNITSKGHITFDAAHRR